MERSLRLQLRGKPSVTLVVDLEDFQVYPGALISTHHSGTNETGKEYGTFRVDHIHTEVEEGRVVSCIVVAKEL